MIQTLTKAQEIVEYGLNQNNMDDLSLYHTPSCIYRTNYCDQLQPVEFLEHFQSKFPDAKVKIKAQLQDGQREMLALDIQSPDEPPVRCIMHCEYDNLLIFKVDLYFQK